MNRVVLKDNIEGKFNFVNFNNPILAKDYELSRIDSNAILTMSNAFYDCIRLLEELDILFKTDNSSIHSSKACLYSVDKHLFLIFLCMLLSLSVLTNKQNEYLYKKHFSDNLCTILFGIYDSSLNNKVYKNTSFTSLIKTTYCFLNIISKDAIDKTKDDKITLNPYVRFYEKVIKRITLNISQSLLFNNYNVHTDLLLICKELSKSWFTDSYFTEKRNDSKQLERLYEKIQNNHYLSPILNYLHENYDKVRMTDIIIKKELFKTIPAKRDERRKDILCIVVKLWLIHECALLNVALDLVDDLVCLEDNYRMNVHISITEMSNQYGIYSYKVHFSCRMTNDFCKLHKAKKCEHYYESREYELERLEFDSYLDLHSSIFTIVKSLNEYINLDLSFDIKTNLEKLKIRGSIDNERRLLRAKDFKGLCFYMFFSKDKQDAYNSYKNRYNAKFHQILNQYDKYQYEQIIDEVVNIYNVEKEKINKTIAKVSESSFSKIYDYIHYCVGNTTDYVNTIFLIESLIMSQAIKEISNNNCSVKNVYDCIWWKSSEISKEEVEDILIKSAKSIFEMYYSIKNYTNSESTYIYEQYEERTSI